jgi:hypothetical protein
LKAQAFHAVCGAFKAIEIVSFVQHLIAAAEAEYVT